MSTVIKKFYKIINPESARVAIETSHDLVGDYGMYGNYSWFNKLIQGSESRQQRYREYDQMSNTVDLNRALDIYGQEITGNNPKADLPLKIKLLNGMEQTVTSTTLTTIQAALKTWIAIHEWDLYIFPLVKNVCKYGDAFFVRSTDQRNRWKWVHPKNVVAAITSKDDVTKVKGWIVKTDPTDARDDYNTSSAYMSKNDTYNERIYKSDDVIHFGLHDNLSDDAPFSRSIFTTIYTIFKQKQMIEDAIVIYRLMRAPEKRVFKVEVGNMPAPARARYLEDFKNQIKQRKIPTPNGGNNQIESIYSPIAQNEDFFLTTKDGKGSTIETLPAGCLDLSTKIPLLDGRTLSLEELIEEYKANKENWVYSVDPRNGEFVPGIVSWAGITHEQAEVYELTLDNGKTVIATADHKFPVWGKGMTELQHLTKDDSIIHFERKNEKINKGNEYEQVYDHSSRSWVFTHRKVRNFIDSIQGKEKNIFIHNKNNDYKKFDVIHHKDYNRYNNSPDNLVWMNGKDHFIHHSVTSKELFAKHPEYRENARNRLLKYIEKRDELLKTDKEYRKQYSDRQRIIALKYIASLTQKQRKKRAIISTNNAKKATERSVWLHKNDPSYKIRCGNNISKSLKNKFKNDLMYRNRLIAHCISITIPANNQRIKFVDDMLIIINHYISCGIYNQEELIDKLNRLPEFMYLWNNHNSKEENKICRITENFQKHHLLMLLKLHGYNSWRKYRTDRLALVSSDNSVMEKKLSNMTEKEVEIFKFIVDSVKEHKSAYAFAKVANENIEIKTKINTYFDELFKEQDKSVSGRRKNSSVRNHTIDKFAKYFGYNTIKHMIEERGLFNHKIVSIRKLDGYRPVGTITVDQKENYHAYHTFALDSGIYTKNSSLGQLDDLEYFYKQMWRGLGIPYSYIDAATESSPISDGKVGIAYMQELQFILKIEQLQLHFEKTFDKEFKRFLRDNNIHVDETVFKVVLPEPSNYKKSRDNEINSAGVNLMNNAISLPFLSTRYAATKYLGWTQAEILENYRMKCEEMGLDYNDRSSMAKVYNPDNADSGGYDGGMTDGSGMSNFGEGGEGLDDLGGEESTETGNENNSEETTNEPQNSNEEK